MSNYESTKYISIDKVLIKRSQKLEDLDEETKASFERFIDESNREVDSTVINNAGEVPLPENTISAIMAEDLAYRFFELYKAIDDRAESSYIQSLTTITKEKAKKLVDLIKSNPTDNPRSEQAYATGEFKTDLLPEPLDYDGARRDYPFRNG